MKSRKLSKSLETGLVEIGKIQLCRREGKKHYFWYGVWEFTHYDKEGNIIWQEVVENALADEGEQSMLDVYLRAVSQGNFYLGLANSSPVDTTTMATLTGEPSGSGYARPAVERSNVGWPVLVIDAGDWQATSKLVTFTATGGTIGPVNVMFLTDILSGTMGKFFAWAALSQARTLLDGESLGCKMKIKLK